MGRLEKSHLIEAAVWFAIVVIFFGYSFEFNQPIEIYEFGATGWPRIVIFMLLIATAGNLYFQYHHGSEAQEGRVGIAESDDSETDYSDRTTLVKLLAILLTPFIFAWLLKPVGIYFGAPFFIALIIWLFGERRWKPMLSVMCLLYGILLLLFVNILYVGLPTGNIRPFYDIGTWVVTVLQ